ncbi:MAG: superoxide dismutase [Legionella sp.]|nr:MAG: superoxide dismutase [Legionella sp.]
MKKISTLLLSSFLTFNIAHAEQTTVTIYPTGDDKNSIGEVVFSETPLGVLVTPKLSKLSPGLHGFHLHQHPNCGDHGMDAGSHYDPQNKNTHLGPYGNGHLGDLPVLYVTQDGTATTPTLAPRLTLKDLTGLTVMIHANGDNYTDTPELGGGGARLACGVVK